MSAKLSALVTLLALSLFHAAGAETLTAPEYRLKIDPRAKITERVETGWETLMTVELEGEKARVRWKAEELSVIFATGTLRVKLTPGNDGYAMVTDFEGKRYKINRSAREVSWLLPGQEVFFRTFGGKVTNVVGTSDFLKITRDTKGGRMSLESQSGTTDVILRKGALEVFEGPEILSHLYFVKGLAFKRGPITLEIPLPAEPFLNALPSDRYLTVESAKPATPAETSPEETPGEAAPEETSAQPADPLRAEPSSWNSPIWKANEGNAKEDPLNARKEQRHSSKGRILEAQEAGDSEEILRVKDY